MNIKPNLSTEDLQRVDAAHHLHPFTDYKALNEEGTRIIVKADPASNLDGHVLASTLVGGVSKAN